MFPIRDIHALGRCLLGMFILLGSGPQMNYAEEMVGEGLTVADQLVASALQFELEGNNSYRDLTLEAAIEQDGNCQAARWQLGQLLAKETWQPVQAVMDANSGDTLIAAYEEQRSQSTGSVDDQMSMAKWADQQGLPDRARWHWRKVFEHPQASATQRKAAIRALGLKRVGDVWLEPQQREEIAAEQQTLEREFIAWAKPINRWQKALGSNRGKARERAIDEIRAVRESSAILPFEMRLSPLSPDVAAAVVETVSSIPGVQATESLARHALQLPWDEVARQSAAALRSRPIHEYAPLVLNSLVAPIEAKSRVVTQGNEVRVERVAYSEGIDSNRMEYATMRTTDRIAGRNSVEALALARFRAGRVIQRDQQQVDQYNQSAATRNSRVFATLETATGEVLPKQPAEWWDWWHQYNDVYEERETDVEYRTVAYNDAPIDDRDYFGPRPRCECFVAGTPVWSETGLRAIETVVAGDRVLAQDQETGELAFKLVLQSTEREPQEVIGLQVAGETIYSTQGHPYWVNGTGWRMAKLIEQGELLHTVGGSAPIAGSKLRPQKEVVYNLLVEDFTSYFVGEVGALVHDNTYRVATQCVVPGLVNAER